MDASPRTRGTAKPTKVSRAFGRKVRALRAERRLTLEEVGAVIGVDKGTMSRIESGEARLGDMLRKAQRLAAKLGVALSDLLP